MPVEERAAPSSSAASNPPSDAPGNAPCCAPFQLQPLATADARLLAKGFAALGDPVRLQLLSLLATSGEGAVCVCDLVEPVGRSQPTVSHHLKVLREAGLVAVEKRGTNNWYALVPGALDALRDVLRTPVPAGDPR